MSVERQLAALNFHSVVADFSYWRRAEGGHRDFSVDVRAMRPIPTPWVTKTAETAETGASIHGSWDVLFECKYRNPSVKWIFAPRTTKPHLASSWVERNTHFFVNGGRSELQFGSVEAGPLDVRVYHNDGRTDAEGLPIIVTRGVEFRPGVGKEDSDEAYSASIRRGVHQLQFAHIPRLSDVLRYTGSRRGLEPWPNPEIEIYVSTLVLVTTAELWSFRPDVDLRSVEQARALEDIAEQVPSVEYVTVASRELRAHQEEWFRAIDRTRSFTAPEREVEQRAVWNQLNAPVISASPSVIVVHHADLEAVLISQAEAIRLRIRTMTEDFARRHGLIVRG